MIAYFDCFAGASGDMILGALVDAGADVEVIRKQVSRIDLGGVEIAAESVTRRGVAATRVLVVTGGSSGIATPASARRCIQEAGLDPEIEVPSLQCLDRLAAAEARVHGVDPDHLRLHELDAADTIVDIVGTAVALRDLGVDRVHASAVASGTGTVETHHGTLPLPVPAVLALLEGAPLESRPIAAELVTPTGAAILAQWIASFGGLPAMRVKSVGYGAGSRDLEEIANVLRVVVGEAATKEPVPSSEVLIEANIDDLNPEFYEYVAERLFALGASDVWMVPAIGKRGRPATIVSVLCSARIASVMRETLFAETSTIGLRESPAVKWALAREWLEVQVHGRPIRVKVARLSGRVTNVAPEYSDCAEVARQTGLPIKEIFRLAREEAGRP